MYIKAQFKHFAKTIACHRVILCVLLQENYTSSESYLVTETATSLLYDTICAASMIFTTWQGSLY